MKKPLIALTILVIVLGAAAATWKTADIYESAIDNLIALEIANLPNDVDMSFEITERNFSFFSGSEIITVTIDIDDYSTLEITQASKMWFFPGFVIQHGAVDAYVIQDDRRINVLDRLDMGSIPYSAFITWRSANVTAVIPAFDLDYANESIITSEIHASSTLWFASNAYEASIHVNELAYSKAGNSPIVMSDLELKTKISGERPIENMTIHLSIPKSEHEAVVTTNQTIDFSYNYTPENIALNLVMKIGEFYALDTKVKNATLHVSTQNINGAAVAALVDLGEVDTAEEQAAAAAYVETILKGSPRINLVDMSFEIPDLEYSDRINGFIGIDGRLIEDGIGEIFVVNPEFAQFQLRNALEASLTSQSITSDHMMLLMMFGIPVENANEVGQTFELREGVMYLNGEVMGQ